jgi:hypothetical protein
MTQRQAIGTLALGFVTAPLSRRRSNPRKPYISA